MAVVEGPVAWRIKGEIMIMFDGQENSLDNHSLGLPPGGEATRRVGGPGHRVRGRGGERGAQTLGGEGAAGGCRLPAPVPHLGVDPGDKLKHLAPVLYEIPHRSPELGDFLLVLADAGRGRVDGGREVPVEQVAEEHLLLP